MRRTLEADYKNFYDSNDTKNEVYTAILLTQLTNGSRIGEAVRAFYHFIETSEREITLQAEKKGNMRQIIIPDVVKKKQSYGFILTISERKMTQRVEKYCERKYGVNTHSLRYSAITYLSKKGIPAQIIAKITGHRELGYITRYIQTQEATDLLRRLAKGKMD